MKLKFTALFSLVFLQELTLAQKPELVIPVGHSKSIRTVTFHPNGHYLATGSDDGTTKLWEVQTGKLIYTVPGEYPFFDSEGKYLLTNRFESSTQVFEMFTGSLVFKAEGDDPLLSRDNKFMITHMESDQESAINVWEFPHGKLIRKIKVDATGSLAGSISPDSKLVLTNLEIEKGRSRFDLWDIESGRKLFELKGAGDARFSRDGKYILMIESPYSTQSFINILDIASLKIVERIYGEDFVISPDGKIFALHVSEDYYELRDASSLQPIGKISTKYGLRSISPDGTLGITEDRQWYPAINPSIIQIPTGIVVDSLSKERGIANESNVHFSSTGKYLAKLDKTFNRILLWSTNPFKLIDSVHTQFMDDAFAFSNDDQFFTFKSGGAENKITIQSFVTGKKVMLNSQTKYRVENRFSSSKNNFLGSTVSDYYQIRDLRSGRLVHQAKGSLQDFSRDESMVVTKDENGDNIVIREMNSGQVVKSVHEKSAEHGTNWELSQVIVSPQGKTLFNTVSQDETWASFKYGKNKAFTSAWEFPSMRLTWSDSVANLAISRDGKTIACTTNYGNMIEIRNVLDYKVKRSIKVNLQTEVESAARNLVFSPRGKLLAFYSSESEQIAIIHVSSGAIDWIDAGAYRVVFSENEKYLFVFTTRGDLRIWALDTFKEVAKFNSSSVLFSADLETFYLGGKEGISSHKIKTGEKLNSFGYEGFDLLAIDSVSSRLVACNDNQLVIFNVKSGETLLTLTEIDSANWVVRHPSGLFDASPGAMEKLYFVAGLETIGFNQLKTRYYEPGLWKKVIDGEKLRNVIGFNSVELPPEIRVGEVDKKGNLPVEVINRGGGIGEVTLYINGKEVIKDLRTPGTDSKSVTLTFSIPVSTNKNLVAGTQNYLAVKAWNAGQWIESRGTVVNYVPPTKRDIKPAIHIVACGVSDYTGNEIDLKYAAKDAEDMAKALELGARRLFGVNNSYLYTLTTNLKHDLYPTKSNIIKAFEKISTTASPTDVIVVYLSGHGVNLGGAEGDFYYLTQDAYTAQASAYNDPAIRLQTTLSSQELVELFKKIPALKQILIIDACASGRVVDNLMARRDIESGTLRALDRMKDRTGMHIITGCTADAVSYEASRYGQGILTYSLLEGIRGLALREDKFVDVNKLFQFAQDRVPDLASGIGGIQSPQVFSPNGSQSFDFGEMTAEDKKLVPIAKERPIYVRSNFIDEQKLRDVLGLGKKMDEQLNNISTKGEDSPLFFVDVSEYPDGCQVSGLYKQTEGKISFRLSKTCEGKETLYNIEAHDEKELLEKVIVLVSK